MDLWGIVAHSTAGIVPSNFSSRTLSFLIFLSGGGDKIVFFARSGPKVGVKICLLQAAGSLVGRVYACTTWPFPLAQPSSSLISPLLLRFAIEEKICLVVREDMSGAEFSERWRLRTACFRLRFQIYRWISESYLPNRAWPRSANQSRDSGRENYYQRTERNDRSF
mmetsp:Transcript_12039/g.17996  ORF Transcript_12039/g.17996 Transcript_12039/m.17996 type:complete len:166 (+) Transcript_12039:2075-2572(+)